MKKFLVTSLRSVKAAALFSLLVVASANCDSAATQQGPKLLDLKSIAELAQPAQNMVDAASAVGAINDILKQASENPVSTQLLEAQIKETEGLIEQFNGKALPDAVQGGVAELLGNVYNMQATLEHSIQQQQQQLELLQQNLGVVVKNAGNLQLSPNYAAFIEKDIAANLSPEAATETAATATATDAKGKDAGKGNKKANKHNKHSKHNKKNKAGTPAATETTAVDKTVAAPEAAATEPKHNKGHKKGNKHNKHSKHNKKNKAEAPAATETTAVDTAAAAAPEAAAAEPKHNKGSKHNRHNKKNKAEAPAAQV